MFSTSSFDFAHPTNNSEHAINNTSNFFEQQSFSGLERVILAEDIELPKLPKEPLTLHYLKKLPYLYYYAGPSYTHYFKYHTTFHIERFKTTYQMK